MNKVAAFEDQYVPQFSRLHWSWAWVLCCATGGLALPLLGIYFAWWVRLRKGRSLALYLYLACALVLLVLWPLSYYVSPSAIESISSGLTLAWWGTAFVLRAELRSIYGTEFEISPWLTAILSVFYLNYCLWAISDSPMPEGRI